MHTQLSSSDGQDPSPGPTLPPVPPPLVQQRPKYTVGQHLTVPEDRFPRRSASVVSQAAGQRTSTGPDVPAVWIVIDSSDDDEDDTSSSVQEVPNTQVLRRTPSPRHRGGVTPIPPSPSLLPGVYRPRKAPILMTPRRTTAPATAASATASATPVLEKIASPLEIPACDAFPSVPKPVAAVLVAQPPTPRAVVLREPSLRRQASDAAMAPATTTSAATSMPPPLPLVPPIHKKTRVEPSSPLSVQLATSVAQFGSPSSLCPRVVIPKDEDEEDGLLSQQISRTATSQYMYSRPIDVALRGLFPATFTKVQFLAAAVATVTPQHVLTPCKMFKHYHKGAEDSGEGKKLVSEFWDAFSSTEYIGEGSFGFVWKCVLKESGAIVAVKSCPISFASACAIDDAYSILREVAVLRLLAEKKVPYVLPLHAAFYVSGCEVLSPPVQQLVDRGLAGEFNEEQAEEGSSKESDNEDEMEMDPEEFLSLLKKNAKIRIPSFDGMSVTDAISADGTIFIVTDLCDGDLDALVALIASKQEKFEAGSDHATFAKASTALSLAKGVGICISSALEAMHALGIVHCDLKPSNVLFKFVQRKNGTKATFTSPHLHPGGKEGAVHFVLSDLGNCQIVKPSSDYLARTTVLTTRPMTSGNDEPGNIGTWEYMDHEALHSQVVDKATDCHSLGAVLFELMFQQRYLSPICRAGPRVPGAKNKPCRDHTPLCYSVVTKEMKPKDRVEGKLKQLLRALAEEQRMMSKDSFRKETVQRVIDGFKQLSEVVKSLLNPKKKVRLSSAGCKEKVITLPSAVVTADTTDTVRK